MPVPLPALPAALQSLGPRTDRMLRCLLCVVALFHLLLATGIALRQGRAMDPMVAWSAALQGLVCLLCLVEHHRGKVLRAARLFVLGQLVLLMVAQLYWGLAAQFRGQLVQQVPLLLVAALLGRRALVVAAAALCALALAGAWVDASGIMFHPDRVLQVTTDLAVSVAGVLLVAWLLHHSVTGLRESLQVAQQRSRELAGTRDALQLEMQARERSRDQLVHAMKMENVGRLASSIAHDFNHLLSLMQGYIAKARRSEGEPLQAALLGADAAVRRAAAVSRRLLDSSRLEAARPQLLDAAATVDALAPMLAQVFDDGVECRLETAGVQCLVHFDPAQLESILLSLAVNAQQAMPAGGRFTLALEHTGDALLMSAADTGMGMDEEVRARCLEPFYTTKPMGQGTGLGLAVTASLVAAAGGAVQVHSRLGAGTRVEIRLPARSRSQVTEDAAAPAG